jgi:hypothetical protein
MAWRPIALCALILAIPRTGLAQEVAAPAPAAEATARKDHLVPLFDIVVFDVLLNRYGRQLIDRGTYDVGASSIRRNLHSAWVIDSDPFATNQFMHPYQGAMYHGFARSAGLNYWESLGYTFAGSALWEIAGETTLPSKNDQIASGIGGSFLGEPLFRIANVVLEKANRLPGFWRELTAAVISPAMGFNRLAYGERFKAVFPSHSPAFFVRVQFGATATGSIQKSFRRSFTAHEGVADFSIDYGLPGVSDYAYRRPFDYFNFQFTSSKTNLFENIFTRGLLAGRGYGSGETGHRGVWGLYGTYDYVAPQVFRASSTALAFGTTFQRRIFGPSALQSTVLAGVGYGAAGTIHETGARDYHYGLTPQILVANRLNLGDRASFDLTLRDYYVSGIASTEPGGFEKVARADGLLTFRLGKHQAVSARYIWSRRAAASPGFDNFIQSQGSFGLFYAYLTGSRFGAVAW